MKLFYSPGACSIAPHILLRELELPHTLQLVSLADGEHNTASYLRINPKARVPALEIGGEIYTEVPALLTYLASLKPEAGLLPALGSVELARTLEWLAWLSSTVHIAFAQFRRPERFLPD
ncbi:MAG: glutathione S-transferase N-terminal domain-containing protein, partial [Caulobacteraceae bacterium]